METLENKSKEWLLGYDAGFNEPNETNCHFTIFSTPEKTLEWEAGNNKGKADRKDLLQKSS